MEHPQQYVLLMCIFYLEFPPLTCWRKKRRCKSIDNDIEEDEGEDEGSKESGGECVASSRRNDNYFGPGFFKRSLIFIDLFEDLFKFDHRDPMNERIERSAHLGGYEFGLIFYCWRRCHQS